MKMKRILILGAGGFGREIHAWVRDACKFHECVFLDDNPQIAEDQQLRVPVLASIQSYEPCPDDVFLCAVGNPILRRSLSLLMKERGGRFLTLVHPTATVADSAAMGEGAIVSPYALISVDAQVGEGVAVYYHSSVDHDAVVGPWSQISAHCDITGNVVLGSEVFVGSHASILPGLRVGDRAVVGAGAVVTHDVPAETTVFGVPARAVARKTS